MLGLRSVKLNLVQNPTSSMIPIVYKSSLFSPNCYSSYQSYPKEMSKPQVFLQCLLLLLLCAELFPFTLADVGVAAQYKPPYLPTACSGNDPSPFPSSNLFAAAGEGVWDNGAACGRQYRVRCISAPTPGTCEADQTILVRIVDRAQTSVSRPSRDDATLVLSTTAFEAIANPSAAWVNVEFAQA